MALRIGVGWSVVLGFALTAAATGPRVPTHVACVGDSITMGVGATTGMSYPDQLQTLYGANATVGNYGHSGATMMNIGSNVYVDQADYAKAKDFVADAGSSAVVDVVIMLGTNDSKPYNWTVDGGPQGAEFLNDALTMIQVFQNLPTHPSVYLAIPPYARDAASGGCCDISGTVLHSEIEPVVRQVAAQAGVPLIDVYTPTSQHPELLADGVHWQNAGYTLIAQTIQTGLARVPSAAVTAPSAGESLPSPISLTAAPDAGTVVIQALTFYADGVSVGSLTQAPFTLSASLAPGQHSVEAEVTDNTGASSRSPAVAFTVLAPVPDAGAPDAGQPSSDGGVLGPPLNNLIIHSGCSAWPALSALPLALAALWLRRSARRA